MDTVQYVPASCPKPPACSLPQRAGAINCKASIPTSLSRSLTTCSSSIIPVTASNKTNVVDPLSAFLVPLDQPGVPIGHRACNRTVRVFDGWTRYDVQLYYKETKAIDGGSDTYSGRIIVCGARYVPVAGHRSTTGPKDGASGPDFENFSTGRDAEDYITGRRADVAGADLNLARPAAMG